MLSTSSLAAIAMLASAAAAVPNVKARATDAESLTPWVTVGDNGTPVTITPVQTTIDGTATVISGAPHDLTGTVFTQTSYGEITTSTGTAPAPTATAADGSGSFLKCNNKDGANAPWCRPDEGAIMYPGTTYYLTWDSTYFTPNTTVTVQGNYLNATTGEVTSQAFESDKMVATWGYWKLAATSDLMQGQSAMNISLQIVALNTTTGTRSTFVKGPTIQIANVPTYHKAPAAPPSGAALYIALPTVFGFIILCVVGGCLWNRKTRKIELGNVMSRSRHGFGLGKPRAGLSQRRKERKAAERVQLMEREIAAGGGQVYRDQPDWIDIPRRDSDALGSLAGTPTDERFHQPGARDGSARPQAGAERNYFRDELHRQDEDRR
ncbi:hypothetical protein JX265_007245 [Neoarthrinium moseri]|uniref:Uncharacterized protein n=1 Tax=Neoarthrinium moseri TaxID=1658444 RepID=A0A9P9WK51_9PEZI|nr:uncharacterized protein JN550_012117 [Neoarthrinium moseri]KAI1850920.1 hypothetical protein JX266_003585 [Neoarthrinium moseri]KAI1859308.1 hypothetical protein JN550_012117 [Neoarthrinium moseri]KAI1867443.1 hypothetical protein JX265_007245 [Neoarthrinium moseri]